MKNIQTKTYIKGKIDFNYQIDNKENEDVSERIKFKVFKGRTYKGQDAVMEITPGREGSFLLELSPGIYSIVELERSERFEFDKTKDQKWDKKCLKKEWSNPLVTFKIDISEPVSVQFKYPVHELEDHPCLK